MAQHLRVADHLGSEEMKALPDAYYYFARSRGGCPRGKEANLFCLWAMTVDWRWTSSTELPMYRHLVHALSVLCISLPPGRIEREIVALHREINEAMFLRRDAAPLEQAALDDLVVVTPGGLPETTEQVIRGTQNFRIDSISHSDVEVRVHGSTAVLTTRLVLHGQLHGVDPLLRQRRQEYVRPRRKPRPPHT